MTNVYEIEARSRKARRLAEAICTVAQRSQVDPLDLAREMNADAWDRTAAILEMRPPSSATIQETLALLVVALIAHGALPEPA